MDHHEGKLIFRTSGADLGLKRSFTAQFQRHLFFSHLVIHRTIKVIIYKVKKVQF